MSLSPPNLSWLRVSPEDRLLLAIARTDLRDENSEEINRVIASGVDWDGLIDLAGFQRLSGFLHAHLSEGPLADKVPEPARKLMKEDHLRIVASGVYFDREIKASLETLNNNDIPVILLKGSFLRDGVFQNSNLRPMSDIDVLVPEARAQQAQELIVRLGYVPVGSEETATRLNRVGHQLPRLRSVDKPTAIEVHRHIVDLDSPLVFDISGFWERAVGVEVQGVAVRTLSPEDHLIHLSIHFMLDRRFKSASALGQLADINAVVEMADPPIDWDLFLRLLRDYELMTPAGCAMTLSRLLLGTPIPPDTASALWPGGTTEEELALFVETRVLSSGGFVVKSLVSPGSRYTLVALLRSIGRRLMPEREYMVSKYGESARGVRGLRFYAVRLVEALRIFGGGVRHPGELRDDFMVDQWMHSLLKKS